jgi:hypothetical protein
MPIKSAEEYRESARRVRESAASNTAATIQTALLEVAANDDAFACGLNGSIGWIGRSSQSGALYASASRSSAHRGISFVVVRCIN